MTVLCLLLQMYNFTSFTVSLNELQDGMEAVLAPTDCRLRPDIRGMENGDMGACLVVGGLAWVPAGWRAGCCSGWLGTGTGAMPAPLIKQAVGLPEWRFPRLPR